MKVHHKSPYIVLSIVSMHIELVDEYILKCHSINVKTRLKTYCKYIIVKLLHYTLYLYNISTKTMLNATYLNAKMS